MSEKEHGYFRLSSKRRLIPRASAPARQPDIPVKARSERAPAWELPTGGMSPLTVLRAFHIPQIFLAVCKDPVKPNRGLCCLAGLTYVFHPQSLTDPNPTGGYRNHFHFLWSDSLGWEVNLAAPSASDLQSSCTSDSMTCANQRCAAKVKVIFLPQERFSPNSMIIALFSFWWYPGLSSESNED